MAPHLREPASTPEAVTTDRPGLARQHSPASVPAYPANTRPVQHNKGRLLAQRTNDVVQQCLLAATLRWAPLNRQRRPPAHREHPTNVPSRRASDPEFPLLASSCQASPQMVWNSDHNQEISAALAAPGVQSEFHPLTTPGMAIIPRGRLQQQPLGERYLQANLVGHISSLPGVANAHADERPTTCLPAVQQSSPQASHFPAR